ncbi:MAG: RluA family pseudouridine synthase [Clostridia bacterium]|nr:RluA family pseudouridine synthase [Clostridia bacterium]
MEEIKLISEEKDIRIDAWLAGQLEQFSRSYIQKLAADGNVFVNQSAVKSNYKLKTGDEIVLRVPEPEKLDVVPEKISLNVLYEDEDIIVIDKPKGMVVHPAVGNYSGTLVNALMDYCGESLSDINGVIRPGIVHRIDKDTSGLLVVAKNNAAHENLSDMLKEHDIKRTYIAVVEGIVREEAGKIDAPIGRHPVDRKKMAVNTKNGRHAVTHFKVLERFKGYSLVELQLETGRTHQIRVHLSYIGFPIVGDEVYGRRKQRFDLQGQALHAKALAFIHPTTGKQMEFHSPLPEYFERLLNELRENDRI